MKLTCGSTERINRYLLIPLFFMVIGFISTFASWEWREGIDYFWWLPAFEFALRSLICFWIGCLVIAFVLWLGLRKPH